MIETLAERNKETQIIDMIEKFLAANGFKAKGVGSWVKGKFEIRKRNDIYYLDHKQRTYMSSNDFEKIAAKYQAMKNF